MLPSRIVFQHEWRTIPLKEVNSVAGEVWLSSFVGETFTELMSVITCSFQVVIRFPQTMLDPAW